MRIRNPTGSGGITISAQAASVTPTQTGSVYTISRLLGGSSLLSLAAGSNANLTLSGTSINATAALGAGNSQTAVVHEALGGVSVEYPVVITASTPSGGGGPAGPYLDATAYQSLPFAKRVVAGYSGPLFQLRRTSPVATMDVFAATGSDYPDQAAIATWIGSSTASVVQVYDQTGNGNHAIAPTTGEQPAYFPYRAQDGMPPIVFQGVHRLDATVTGDRQNVSILVALQTPSLSANLWSLTDAYGAGKETVCFPGFQSYAPVLQYWNGTAQAISRPVAYNPSIVVRSNPAVLGYTSSATERRVFAAENSAAGAADTSSAISKFTVGKCLSTVNAYGTFALWGFAVSKAALATAVANADIATIASACAMTTSFTARLVAPGDSIQNGQGSITQGNKDQVTMTYLIAKAKPSLEIINIGRPGYRLDTEYAQRASTSAGVANINGLYTSAYGAGKCLLWIQAGTNDLAGTSDGTNSSTPDAATLYGTATSFVSAEKTVGYTVFLSDILPRNDGSWNGTKEQNRLDYRTLVLANTAGADYVIDIADPATPMGVATSAAETTLYTYQGTQLRKFAESGAGLHPTSYGYTLYYQSVVSKLTAAGF